MRPNVDIPWSVHGKIKEYSQAEDKTIEEAYIETLKEGLSVMPTPVQSGGDFKELSIGGFPFGPRTVPISPEDERDINDICTFFPTPSFPNQPVTFKTTWRRITIDELEEALLRVSSVLNEVYGDWFTFHQLGGAWVGSGMRNFVHSLRTLENRLEEADFDIYKTGPAIYLLEIEEGEYLALRLEIDVRSAEIERFTIGFLTDGHPVDGSKYRNLISQFGFSRLENGRDRKQEDISVTPEEEIDLNVVETIEDESRMEDKPWVKALIVENPIQKHDGLRKQVLNKADEKFRNSPVYSNPYDQLVAYDHAYVRLKQHHPADEGHKYHLQGLSAVDFTSIFGRETIWNLSIGADWY